MSDPLKDITEVARRAFAQQLRAGVWIGSRGEFELAFPEIDSADLISDEGGLILPDPPTLKDVSRG